MCLLDYISAYDTIEDFYIELGNIEKKKMLA